MAAGEGAAQRNRQWLLARRPAGMVSESDFEHVPRTFLRLFTGANEGKQLLRL